MPAKEDKKRVFWTLGIFAFFIISIGIILQADAFANIRGAIQLEAVWIISALFIVSFAVIAFLLHHHRVGSWKRTIVHEFMEMSSFGKFATAIFLLTLALMIVAAVLIYSDKISFTGFEIEEEWIIITLALVSYIALIVEVIRKKKK